MQRETELLVLQCMRIAGYANFAWLTLALLGMKGGWQSWLLLALPVVVSVLGALLYYTAWDRVFQHTPRTDGRSFARPYILGTALLAGTAALLLFLAWLSTSRT